MTTLLSMILSNIISVDVDALSVLQWILSSAATVFGIVFSFLFRKIYLYWKKQEKFHAMQVIRFEALIETIGTMGQGLGEKFKASYSQKLNELIESDKFINS